jgi:hypothetical protein
MEETGSEGGRGTLKTPQGQLLDHPDTHAKARQLLKNGIAGTGAKYDSGQVAGKILDLVLGETAEPEGIHVETVLTALGALAGFSAQMAIREDFVKSGKISAEKAFNVVTTADGSTWYFGDVLNEGLVSTRQGSLAVWSLVGGAAQQLGAKDLPDLKDIFAHVSRTVGGTDFGVPRLPPEHMPQQPPFELLEKFWNPVRNFMATSVGSPSHWPLVLGYAAQLAIKRAKGLVDPGMAARIVMEAAIPMSKVDPQRIYGAYF